MNLKMAYLSVGHYFLWRSGCTRKYALSFLLCWLWLSVRSSHSCEVYRSYKCINEDYNQTNQRHCLSTELEEVTIETFNDSIKARFLHLPFKCNFDKYELKLMVIWGVDSESSCNSSSSKSSMWKMHSEIDQYVSNNCEGAACNSSSCGEFVEVEFGHVFSACYMLELTPKHGSSTHIKRRSSAMYISTGYIKPNISEESVELYPTYSYSEKKLKINFFNHLMFKQVFIKVKVQSKESVWIHSEFELCNRGTESNPDLIVEKQINGTCHHNNTMLWNIIVENVPSGNYTITVEASDDRCKPDSIWTESVHCKWKLSENGTISIDIPVVVVTSNAIMWISIIIAVILFHAIIFTWFVMRRRNSQILEVQHESMPLNYMESKVNLLLLYPRDCSQFMKTMSSFRRLLELFENVEVYDCYAVEDNMQDPLDWLRTVMNYPRLCIIIVTTPCACILQEAIHSGAIDNPCNVYKNPTYLDSVFIYGLKQIMNDFSCDVYQRIHIIGVGGFSEDSKIISLPTSLTRYNIPEHLDALILKMSLKYKQGGSYQYSPEYIHLRNSITSLKYYKRQYPEYLREVLNLSEP